MDIVFDPKSFSYKRRIYHSYPKGAYDIELRELHEHILDQKYNIELLSHTDSLIEYKVTENNKHFGKVQIFKSDLITCSCKSYCTKGLGECKHTSIIKYLLKHPDTKDERDFSRFLQKAIGKLQQKVNYAVWNSLTEKTHILGSGITRDLVPSYSTLRNAKITKPLKTIFNTKLNRPYILTPNISLYDYQIDILEKMIDAKRAICSMVMGAGKANPVDTKILTPTGWKLMKDLRIGDKIIGQNGNTTYITGIFPQGQKDIYKITFSDDSVAESCDEHLWNVKNVKDRMNTNSNYRTLPLLEIKKKLFHKNGQKVYSIPLVDPINFTEQNVPVDPYLLGILIGDGSLCNKSVTFSSTDKEIIDYVNSIVSIYNTHLSKSPNSKINYRISKNNKKSHTVNNLTLKLKELNLMGKKSYEKFIPECYLYNSKEIRLSILQGLMDTDGTCTKRGDIAIFYSTSIQLAKDVQNLVWSLGGISKIRTLSNNWYSYKGIKKKGRIAYAVSCILPNEIKPFRLNRKLEKVKSRTKYPATRYIKNVEYIGKKEAMCISVSAPDRLYVIDNYIVTHNTLTSIAAIKELNLKNVLIVCPKTIMVQWEKEIKRVLNRDIFFIKGNNISQFLELNCIGIITYQTLNRNIGKLKEKKYDLIIADEIQFIRNNESKTWNAFNKLNSEYFFGLSGTVIENKIDDLYNIMQIVNPGLLGHRWKFNDKFRKIKSISKRKILYENTVENLPDLRELLKGNVFSYDKLNLPGISYNNHFVSLDKTSQKIHDDYMEKANRLISKSLNTPLSFMEKAMVQAFLLKARQACNSIELIDGDILPSNAKIDKIMDLINEVCIKSNSKLVIFSEWTTMLDIIQREVINSKFGFNTTRLDGSMKPDQRYEAVKKFQNDPDCKIFFSSDAGGLGLDGLQLVSNDVLHIELPWNPAKLDQRNGRLNRIMQKNKVNVHYLIAKNSIEQKIQKLLSEKRQIRQDALFS